MLWYLNLSKIKQSFTHCDYNHWDKEIIKCPSGKKWILLVKASWHRSFQEKKCIDLEKNYQSVWLQTQLKLLNRSWQWLHVPATCPNAVYSQMRDTHCSMAKPLPNFHVANLPPPIFPSSYSLTSLFLLFWPRPLSAALSGSNPHLLHSTYALCPLYLSYNVSSSPSMVSLSFLLPRSLPENFKSPSSFSLPSHWPSDTLFTNQNQLRTVFLQCHADVWILLQFGRVRLNFCEH